MESPLSEIKRLVDTFSANEAEITNRASEYNETLLRRDFVDPFFKALGWDIDNTKALPQYLREVVHEANIQVEKTKKRPDYAFRLAGTRKFFVEAKKPSVQIEKDSEAAFQLRRYGWSAKMPISVLTNFKYLIIYDCRYVPKEEENYLVCKLSIYHYSEFVEKFNEIHTILSRESTYSGKFDELFPIDQEIKGSNQIDSYFLSQIDKWRLKLGSEIIKMNKDISPDELNYLVNTFLNRVVFLRICEDRELEKYEALLNVNSSKVYKELLGLFQEADQKYNSDLFDFTKDTLSPKIGVGNEILLDIIRELYYPRSPYIFSVIESNILGDIYELFLTKKIGIRGKKKVELEEKPEIPHDKGVITTPKFIIDYLTDETLRKLCEGESPDDLVSIKIADIACGSGSFLLQAYQYLLDYSLSWYLKDPEKHKDKIRQGPGNFWYLNLSEKRRILLNNIYGVDLDENAVEVTKFSLLVKLLEGETNESIKHLFLTEHLQALPHLRSNIKCGNSLVDKKVYKYKKASSFTTSELNLLKPFEWKKEFPEVSKQMGFDLITGNPPYTRIQTMKKVSPLELAYYQSKHSNYLCGKRDNFDKYMLFVERSLGLLKDGGRLGYIIPHKFTKIKAGESLRDLISKDSYLEELVLFGTQQVFGKKSTTYTLLLILRKADTPAFKVEMVTDLQGWKVGNRGHSETFSSSEISRNPWVFLVGPLKKLIERIKQIPTKLKDCADIYVGLQTSKDEIYIIQPLKEKKDHVLFNDYKGKRWKIEKDILKPCIYDLILFPFATPKPNGHIIFPYHKDDKGETVLYSEEEMEEKFPNAWDCLKHHKKELLKRDIQPYSKEEWYKYGRSQSLAKFDGREKLIVKVLSREPCFPFDSSNILFTGGGNGPYYGVSLKEGSLVTLRYIQAFLNSKLVEIMVRSSSSVFRGEYYSYGKQFINDIPIPIVDMSTTEGKEKHDEIVRLAKKLQQLNDKLSSTKLPSKREIIETQISEIKEELDNLILDVYQVKKEEKKLLFEYTV